jgi:hypothetical protein
MSRVWDELVGGRALAAEVGWWRTLRLGAWIDGQRRRGEPFGHLPPPADERERLSRQQASGAILLYRALVHQQLPEPLVTTRRVMAAAGASFLRSQLGPLTPRKLATLTADGLRELGERFFNATIRWDDVGEHHVKFTVTTCTFPALCVAAGHPELAPLFCAVDDAYFGTIEKGVRLDRPHTIARGHTSCAFHLYRESAAAQGETTDDRSNPPA